MTKHYPESPAVKLVKVQYWVGRNTLEVHSPPYKYGILLLVRREAYINTEYDEYVMFCLLTYCVGGLA